MQVSKKFIEGFVEECYKYGFSEEEAAILTDYTLEKKATQILGTNAQNDRPLSATSLLSQGNNINSTGRNFGLRVARNVPVIKYPIRFFSDEFSRPYDFSDWTETVGDVVNEQLLNRNNIIDNFNRNRYSYSYRDLYDSDGERRTVPLYTSTAAKYADMLRNSANSLLPADHYTNKLNFQTQLDEINNKIEQAKQLQTTDARYAYNVQELQKQKKDIEAKLQTLTSDRQKAWQQVASVYGGTTSGTDNDKRMNATRNAVLNQYKTTMDDVRAGEQASKEFANLWSNFAVANPKTWLPFYSKAEREKAKKEWNEKAKNWEWLHAGTWFRPDSKEIANANRSMDTLRKVDAAKNEMNSVLPQAKLKEIGDNYIKT